MRTTRTGGYRDHRTLSCSESALRLAVRLTLSQLSNEIGLSEAVQFAAHYYDVTCSSIEAELKKREFGHPKARSRTMSGRLNRRR